MLEEDSLDGLASGSSSIRFLSVHVKDDIDNDETAISKTGETEETEETYDVKETQEYQLTQATEETPSATPETQAVEEAPSCNRRSDPLSIDQLKEKCSKYAYLDGTFFTVDYKKSTTESIISTCVACNKNIKGALTVSSNFATHLKRVHSDIYGQYLDHKIRKKDNLHEKEERVNRRVTCHFSQKQFETNITSFVLDNMLSHRLVEAESFRKIFDDMQIKNGNTPLKHVTRYLLHNKIKEIDRQMHEKIINSLQNVSHICTTADIWTSLTRRYIGVTAHWIDSDNFEKKSVALACKRFPGTHSYDKIALMLKDIDSDYNIDNSKIVGTVTDNGSNFVKAFKEFGLNDCNILIPENEFSDDITNDINNDIASENIRDYNVGTSESAENDENPHFSHHSEYDVVFENNANVILPQHFRCASHTLNLLATSDFSKIIDKIPKVKNAHFRVLAKCEALWKNLKSPKTREKMNAYFGVGLKKPVITRWNSTYDSFVQIYSLKTKIMDQQLRTLLKFYNIFILDDFNYLQKYIEIMKPLAITLDRLQGENTTYYGCLLPNLISLRNNWRSLHNIVDDVYKIELEALVNKLEDRFKDMFDVEGNGEFAAMAALSHPQFKSIWVKCLTLTAQEKIYLLIRSSMQRSTTTTFENTSTNDIYDFGASPSESTLIRIISQPREENEFLNFLKAPTSEDLTCLNSFPSVKEIFLKYNSVMPSSAPVERLFSYVTLLNLPKYNKLNDTEFEKRILLKINGRKLK